MTVEVILETRRVFVMGPKMLRKWLFDYAEKGWYPEGFTPDTADIWYYWNWEAYTHGGGWLKLYRKTATCYDADTDSSVTSLAAESSPQPSSRSSMKRAISHHIRSASCSTSGT